MSTTRHTLPASLASALFPGSSAIAPEVEPLPAHAPDPTAALIERHRALETAMRNDPDKSDEATDTWCKLEDQALEALLTARHMTWTDFAQLATYLQDYIARTGDWSFAAPCLAALADASRQLVEGGAA